MQPRGDLLKRSQQPIPNISLTDHIRPRRANVINALENHGVFHARGRQDVPVDPRQQRRAQAVVQDPIPARREIEHRDTRRRRRQPLREHVRPPVVAVGRAAPAVGDAVAEDGEGATFRGDVP